MSGPDRSHLFIRREFAFDAQMVTRSADDNGTGAVSSSAPVRRRITRAMSSCASDGRLLAAAIACSSKFVIVIQTLLEALKARSTFSMLQLKGHRE